MGNRTVGDIVLTNEVFLCFIRMLNHPNPDLLVVRNSIIAEAEERIIIRNRSGSGIVVEIPDIDFSPLSIEEVDDV